MRDHPKSNASGLRQSPSVCARVSAGAPVGLAFGVTATFQTMRVNLETECVVTKPYPYRAGWHNVAASQAIYSRIVYA